MFKINVSQKPAATDVNVNKLVIKFDKKTLEVKPIRPKKQTGTQQAIAPSAECDEHENKIMFEIY